MRYLISPIKSFSDLQKRARLGDALFVVASIWVLLLGIQLAELAAVDALTFAITVWLVLEVTIAIFIAWVGVAGLGYLIQHAAGGKATFVPMLVMTALAATPLAILGIVAVVFELVAAVVPVSSDTLFWVTRSLLWTGVAIGAPGLYFAGGLQSVAKVDSSTAVMTSVFLTLAIVLVFLLRNNALLVL